jgi:hypothetical protein
VRALILLAGGHPGALLHHRELSLSTRSRSIVGEDDARRMVLAAGSLRRDLHSIRRPPR